MRRKNSCQRVNGKAMSVSCLHRRGSIAHIAGVSFALALFFVTASPAAADGEDDWPCVQRKVDHLSVAQVWSGPPIPEEAAAWRGDRELASLVARISARRTDLAEVAPLLQDIGPAGDRSRDERLLAIFAGVFRTIDRERSRLIEGIGRYASKQRGLAEQIDAKEAEIRAARAAAAPDDYDALDRIEELEDSLAWDIRIYQDRHRSLTFVCESPVILERRAFAAAQMIQGELGRE